MSQYQTIERARRQCWRAKSFVPATAAAIEQCSVTENEGQSPIANRSITNVARIGVENAFQPRKIDAMGHVQQRSAKRLARGCVNLASWLPLTAGGRVHATYCPPFSRSLYIFPQLCDMCRCLRPQTRRESIVSNKLCERKSR